MNLDVDVIEIGDEDALVIASFAIEDDAKRFVKQMILRSDDYVYEIQKRIPLEWD